MEVVGEEVVAAAVAVTAGVAVAVAVAAEAEAEADMEVETPGITEVSLCRCEFMFDSCFGLLVHVSGTFSFSQGAGRVMCARTFT